MNTPTLMFQGTGSDVGKSLLVAGLCRLYARRGLRVRPFKPQNMSNNAAVAEDGGEIGRAQWLQAFAAKVPASVHMNPVLLKPESDQKSQVIVQGKIRTTSKAADYQQYRANLQAAVMDSYHRLCEEADLILVEGAGSPAEINLRAHDIANMGFAQAVGCPVVMIGDIDRGGVIASLVGTKAVLSQADNAMIRAFIINKFRGDVRLFDDGLTAISERTAWRNIGVVPYLHKLRELPQEDALTLPESKASRGAIRVVALAYPHLANFDDLDPLMQDENVHFSWLRAGDVLPSDTDIVALPGSKSTITDLAFVRAQGWDSDIAAHLRRGGRVIGLCGGYQMLGKTLADPHGVEGAIPQADGLGLLAVHTVFGTEKTVTPWRGVCAATGAVINAYEIHLGQTAGADNARPVARSGAKPEGAMSVDGRVWGSYLHGIFTSDAFRAHILQRPTRLNYWQKIDTILDEWADLLESVLDTNMLLTLAKERIQVAA